MIEKNPGFTEHKPERINQHSELPPERGAERFNWKKALIGGGAALLGGLVAYETGSAVVGFVLTGQFALNFNPILFFIIPGVFSIGYGRGKGTL